MYSDMQISRCIVTFIISLFILTVIFPGGTGLAGTRMTPFLILLGLTVKEVVVATGAINRCAKLQSNHYHHQTNIQLLYRRMPFLSPSQQCQSTGGKSYLYSG